MVALFSFLSIGDRLLGMVQKFILFFKHALCRGVGCGRYFFTWRGLAVLTLFMCSLLGAYTFHLNAIVVEKFEGPRFFLPNRIYARSLELYPGKKWSKAHLLWELGKLHYEPVEVVQSQGQYRDHGVYVEIYTRDFRFWDGLESGQWVRLTFVNGFVSTLQNQHSGRDIESLRLEPMMITGGGDPHEDRKLVELEQLPENLINALIATEDQRFYRHWGVDPKSLARAFVSTVSGNGIQGGSTITQQLVKNFYLTPERTLKRKFNEMLMALILDWRYEKDEILETYFNEVYFGQDGSRSIHGVQLASEFFFGKSVEQLELAQCATLVGMLKGPSYYNPQRHLERARSRRDLVIGEMLQQGYISVEQANEARNQPLLVSSGASVANTEYPAFLDQVFRDLEGEGIDIDASKSGLKVFTYLDPVAQMIAETAMLEQLSQLENERDLPVGHLQSAIVIVRPGSGQLAAVVGGREVRFDGFNRSLDAKRQVGSLIKPVAYLTALEQPDRFNLTSMLDDTLLEVELPGGTWTPQNYDKRYHGMVPLWEALAYSYNIPAVRVGMQVGLQAVADMVGALGAESSIKPYASMVLGAQEMSPLEVAKIYNSIASWGVKRDLRAVVAVVSGDDRVVIPPAPAQPVASQQASYLITRALQHAVSEGTGRSLQRYVSPALAVAGKTGTTDDLRDSWFVGYNDDWLGVVWIGNDLNQPIALTGATGALTVWGKVFQQLGLAAYQPVQPKGVREYPVHRLSGRRVSSRCDDSVVLPFVVGSEPSKQFGCGGSRPGDSEEDGWFDWLWGT